MPGAFETATRAAIEELIQTHAQASKFGFILTNDGVRGLTDALFELLATSRTLKNAGDRFLAGAAAPRPATPPRTPTLKPRPTR